MKQVIFFSLLIMILASSAFSIVLEDYNYATQDALTTAYTVTVYDTTMSVNLSLSSTIKEEGSAALKVNFTHSSGLHWQYARFYREGLNLDLSNAKRFSIWLKGDAAVYDVTSLNSTKLLWIPTILGSDGYRLRYVDWESTTLFDTTWHKISWQLSDMEQDPWGGGFSERPNFNNVAGPMIQLMINDANAGNYNLYFDDFEYYNTSSQLADVLVDGFEYASDSAIKANWIAIPSSVDSVIITRSTAEKKSGNSAMNIYYWINDYWADVYASQSLATPIDISNVKYIKVWFKGDNHAGANLSDEWDDHSLFLGDTASSYILANFNEAILDTTWNCYMFEVAVLKYNLPAYYITGPFTEYDWDPAGSSSVTDITAINKLGFKYNLNRASNPTSPKVYNVYYDDITFVVSTNLSLTVDTFSITARPGGAAIPVNVLKGIAPYTWSLSTVALGTLSATTGASISFTPGSVSAAGTLTVTDADGQVVNIPVAITPTAAPIVPESSYRTIDNKYLKTNWNLFE